MTVRLRGPPSAVREMERAPTLSCQGSAGRDVRRVCFWALIRVRRRRFGCAAFPLHHSLSRAVPLPIATQQGGTGEVSLVPPCSAKRNGEGDRSRSEWWKGKAAQRHLRRPARIKSQNGGRRGRRCPGTTGLARVPSSRTADGGPRKRTVNSTSLVRRPRRLRFAKSRRSSGSERACGI